MIDTDLPPIDLIEIRSPPPAVAEAPDTGRSRWPSGRWAAVATGVALVTVAVAVATALLRSPAPPAPPVGTVPAAVAGTAELVVVAYLQGGDAPAGDLRRLYPAAPDVVAPDGPARFVARTITVGATGEGHGTWAVAVAAEVLALEGDGYRREPTHHYLVGVAETGSGAVATGLPVRVAEPAPTEIPAVVAGTPSVDAVLDALVEGFVAAHSTGTGDLRPYIVTGAAIRSVDPPPYTDIDIGLVTVVDLGGGLRHVAAEGVARDTAGAVLPVQYHLRIAREGGAWKVAALAAGPPAAGGVPLR